MLLSLVAAFGIWMLVEDQENPRTQAVVPLETNQAIPVTPLNVPDDAILRDQPTVRVRVEARNADIEGLREGDFRATIDLRGVTPGEAVSRPVRVESRRGGVRVLSVQPSQVDITLVRAATREVPVQVRLNGEFPSGYRLKEGVEPSAEPSIVKLRGPADLIDSVEVATLEVSVAGLRDGVVSVESDLVARTSGGNRVEVAITPERSRATLRIEQTFSQRALALSASVTGSPAPGYRITNISIDPPSAIVAGPKSLVDFLQSLAIEKVDVNGAKTDVTQTKQIDRPPNVTIDRQTVVVRVEVRAIECSTAQPASPCISVSYVVGPVFTDFPAGMTVEGASQVVVRVFGPLPQIQQLKAADIRATVSLTGVTVGTSTLNPVVTILPSGPPGLRAEADALPVKIVPLVFP
ncbi:MAG: CdaR family protein [Gemmatimonadaceae bacterium]